MFKRNPDHAAHDSYQNGDGWHLWSCDGGALSEGPSKVSLRLNGEDILLTTDLPSANPGPAPWIRLRREHLPWLAEVIPQAMDKLTERDRIKAEKDLRDRLREKIRASKKTLLEIELEADVKQGTVGPFTDGYDMPADWLHKVSRVVGFWDFP